MMLSLIVAMDRNGVIGRQGDLPWRLKADLQRFKRLTMGHPIVMGRKTYESINRLLPGRTTVIVTRQPTYQVPGAIVVGSVAEAVAACQGDDEVFITGGAEIYRESLPEVGRLYLTRVLAEVDGDTHFTGWDPQAWDLVSREHHAADADNEFPVDFEVWDRRKQS